MLILIFRIVKLYFLDNSSNNTSVPAQNNNDTLAKRNLPFKQPDDAKARSGDNNEDISKPPVLAIILTSLCVMFVIVVLVLVWVYSRKRRGTNLMELKWKKVEENQVRL